MLQSCAGGPRLGCNASSTHKYTPAIISTGCKGRERNIAITQRITGKLPKLLENIVHCPFSRSQDQTYNWRRCGVAQQGASKQFSVSLIHCKGTLWRNSSFTYTRLLQRRLFFPSKKVTKTRCSKHIKVHTSSLCIFTGALILTQAGIPNQVQDQIHWLNMSNSLKGTCQCTNS